MTSRPVVLSLCDLSGVMVMPWARNGFDCHILDIRHPAGSQRGDDGITRIGADLSRWRPARGFAPSICFAFPPCTDLAISGARWFKAKGEDKIEDALRFFRHTEEIVKKFGCPYMIENPVGIVSTRHLAPSYYFDPADYAGYGDDSDCYVKRTCLWTGGGFLMPARAPRPPVLGSKMHRVGPGKRRAEIRSETPGGFAFAVFLANASKVVRSQCL